MDGEMQYSRKELSNWYNFGKLPKRKLPIYITNEEEGLDVFGVIEDTLKNEPGILDALKEYITGK